jgi:hypothetical protein
MLCDRRGFRVAGATAAKDRHTPDRLRRFKPHANRSAQVGPILACGGLQAPDGAAAKAPHRTGLTRRFHADDAGRRRCWWEGIVEAMSWLSTLARDAPAKPGAYGAVLAEYARPLSPWAARRRKALLLVAIACIGVIYGSLFAVLPQQFVLLLIIPLGLLALVVIWALPEQGVVPRAAVRLMEGLFYCYLVAAVLWPFYLGIAIKGLPALDMRRLFSVPMLLMLLICVSISSDFRDRLKAIFAKSPIMLKMFLGFVAIQTVATLLSPISLDKFGRQQIEWTAVFFVAVYMMSKPGRMARWSAVIVLMAAALGVIGLLENEQQQILWINHIPEYLKMDPRNFEQFAASTFRDGVYRVRGTFSVSLSLAEYLAVVMPFLIHIFMISRNLILRGACLVAHVLIIAVIVLTQSRMGVLGAMVAHAAYVLVWSVHRWRTQRTSLLGPAFTLAYPAGVVLMIAAILWVPAVHHRVLGGGTHQFSDIGRKAQLAQSLPLIAKSPVFGYGPSQGVMELGYVGPDGLLTIDSYMLSIALDYGLIGFGLYYGMILLAMVTGLQVGARHNVGELSYAQAAAAALTVWLVSKIVLSQPDNTSMIFMVLAMIVAARYRSETELPAAAETVRAAPALTSRPPVATPVQR